MINADASPRVGVAVIGLAGAVATTAAAGIELIRQGHSDHTGLPLAGLPSHLTQDLTSYESLVFRGWDFFGDDLATAAREHDVLDERQQDAAASGLAAVTPWPGIANERFCRNVSGEHCVAVGSHAEAVEAVQADLDRFRDEENLDALVVMNLASTESVVDPSQPVYASPEAFEEAVAADDEAISPAMLYAYAAIDAGVPYVNFTPSAAADLPALVALAEQHGVPVAGKDGKTGQTFIKTALAPSLRDRALKVDGWFSTNILGNRDGVALKDKDALASKVGTKSSVLDQILGYEMGEDHIVNIQYYGPRGDNKEAWDNIDLTGFLGQQMQLKINFLCRDSILAAPLAIELARLMNAADRRGEGGVQEAFGAFFKSPTTANGQPPEHALPEQQRALLKWLADGAATDGTVTNGQHENGAAGNGQAETQTAGASS